MEPEHISKLDGMRIDKGNFVAFVHEQSKKVIGVADFKNGGIAKGENLQIMVKPSMEALLSEFKRLGYTYTPPDNK